MATERLVVELDANTTKLTKSIGRAKAEIKGLETQTKKTDKSMANFSRRSGMAGIQFQQFIGQVQGGQSAMLALSQQSADLGFVLGAPLLGAVAGISASIVGLLLPSLLNSKDAMKLLEVVAEDLKNTLGETSDGVLFLSEDFEKLVQKSEALARLQISSSIVEAEKLIKISAEGIKDSLEGAFGGTTESVLKSFAEDVRNSAMKAGVGMDEMIESISKGEQGLLSFGGSGKITDTIRIMSDNFKISREQAAGLALAISDVFNDQSPANIRKLQNTMTDLNDSTGGASKELVKMAKELIPLFTAMDDGIDRTNLLRIAFGDLSHATKQSVIDAKAAKDEFNALADLGQTEADPQLIFEAMNREENNRLMLEATSEFIEAVNALQDDNITTIEERLAHEIEINKAALASKLIDEEEFAKAQQRTVKNFVRGKKDEEKQVKKSELSKLNTQQNAIRAGMAANELLFNDNKAIAAGLIVADTATGIMKSLSINPYDYINVGIIAATGALNLASALGASKGGGSISSGGASGVASQPPQQDFEQDTTSLDITDATSGGSENRGISFPTDTGDELIDVINRMLNKANGEGR